MQLVTTKFRNLDAETIRVVSPKSIYLFKERKSKNLYFIYLHTRVPRFLESIWGYIYPSGQVVTHPALTRSDRALFWVKR